jgi:hypothetical protein
MTGYVFLKVGKIAALGSDGAAAHLLQFFGGPLNGGQARIFILLPYQGVVVYAFGNLILNWIRKGAGIADIARKSRVGIVQDNDSQTHSIAAVIFAGPDIIDVPITIMIKHGTPPI